MAKQFNDAVTYIRNGQPIPAIVLKSSEVEGEELLTLLYADPDNGPNLINQGTVRNIALVQTAVKPGADGRLFAWKNTEAGKPVAELHTETTEYPDGTLEIGTFATGTGTYVPGQPLYRGKLSAEDLEALATKCAGETETVRYEDGSSATGIAPVPRVSPEGSPIVQIEHVPNPEPTDPPPAVDEKPVESTEVAQ